MQNTVSALTRRNHLNPLHAMLLAFPMTLFVSAVICDIAFLNTAQIQWSNFSAWLIAGGLIFGGLAVVWAIAATVVSPRRKGPGAYLLMLGAMWLIGLINAFLHARDAWYSVTATGLVLSIVTAFLALAAAWTGYRGFAIGEIL